MDYRPDGSQLSIFHTRANDEVELCAPAPEDGFIYQWGYTDDGSKYLRVPGGWYSIGSYSGANPLFFSDQGHPHMLTVPKRKLDRKEQ